MAKTSTRFLGFCPCCDSMWKIQKNLLVHHGYLRPGDGEIHRDCFGVRMTPHELSPDTAKSFVAALREMESNLEKRLVELPNVTTLTLTKWERKGWQMVPVLEDLLKETANPHKWADELEKAIRKVRHKLESIRFDITRVQAHVDTWVAKPLKTFEEDVAEKKAVSDAKRNVKAAERLAKVEERLKRYQGRIDSAVRRKNANALADIWEKLNEDLIFDLKMSREEIFARIDRASVWQLFGLVPGGRDYDRATRKYIQDEIYLSNEAIIRKMRGYGIGAGQKWWPADPFKYSAK